MSDSNAAIPVVCTAVSDSSSSDWGTDDSGEDADSRRGNETRIGATRLSSSYNTLVLCTGVAMSGPPRGTLRLDKTEARAGESVGVYWDIPTVLTCPEDWIGVYEKGQCVL